MKVGAGSTNMKSRRRVEGPPRPSWQRPSGLVEFEYVPMSMAKAIANDLPSGVENMLDRVPGYWHRVRRPMARNDLVLLPLTMEWMRTLPKEIWPLQTGATYARVLNRIAQVWAHADQREFTFQDLLNDRRKNRRGFPEPVKQELQALHLYSLGLASGRAVSDDDI